MDFRRNMDLIWVYFLRERNIYLILLFLFMLSILEIFNLPLLPLNSFEGIATSIVLGIGIVYLVFVSTVEVGYVDLVKVYRPAVAVNSRFGNIMAILIIGMFWLFGLIYYIGTLEHAKLFFEFVWIVSLVVFVPLKIYESRANKRMVKQYFKFIILTSSKLVVYIAGGDLLKFDRVKLVHNFSDNEELELAVSGSKVKKIVVNIMQLPEEEKQELRTLLGEETLDLNKD